MSLQKELTIQEIKRKIHNLHQQQSRLRVKERDPDAFLKKERQRHKDYWANLDPEKKKQKIAKQSEINKKRRPVIAGYQRKSYKKNREKILEKKKIDRINRPEYYHGISKKSYKKHRIRLLAERKQHRLEHGDEMRARERELSKLRKNKK